MTRKICALTDVPFYVMWIIFFIVWTFLLIDFLRRTYAKKALRGEIALVCTDQSGREEEERKSEKEKQ